MSNKQPIETPGLFDPIYFNIPTLKQMFVKSVKGLGLLLVSMILMPLLIPLIIGYFYWQVYNEELK